MSLCHKKVGSSAVSWLGPGAVPKVTAEVNSETVEGQGRNQLEGNGTNSVQCNPNTRAELVPNIALVALGSGSCHIFILGFWPGGDVTSFLVFYPLSFVLTA
jgi:hypothetical protein